MQAGVEVPNDIREVIDGVVESAKRTFGDHLKSIVLYGSAAEGQMRATSDVNLMFVLKAFDATRVNGFREPFRFAGAAHEISAMFILEEELEHASREFAQKFADMKRRHVVLYGDDPLPALDIPRDALVRRVQQVLLNLTMRMREMYITRSLREEQCVVTLADATAPMRTAAAMILELEGRGTKTPKEALYAFVSELGDYDFVELLPHLSEAREKRSVPPGRGAVLLFRALELARALHRRSLDL
jgi:predicted nucleotidyltransferase